MIEELLNKLSLISNVTRDDRAITIVDSIDEITMTITPKIIDVEPDEFFDDPFDLEVSLITKMKEACEASGNVEDIPQGRTVPEGRSKCAHYSALMDVAHHLADARIYKNTKRSRADYLIVSSDLLPVFVFTQDFKPELVSKINGIYVAGSYKDIPVLVAPVLDRCEMIWGVCADKASSVVIFLNDEGHLSSKIVNPNSLLLMKLKD